MAIKKNNNSILALSAILFVVLAITLYLVNSYYSFNREIKTLRTTSVSTEVVDIETDLNNTDLSNLDRELQDIENEINSAY